MRQRRPGINWFLVVVLIILIGIVTYVDKFILPTAQSPFLPTLTSTREPESYVAEAEKLFTQGKLLESIDAYLEAMRIQPEDPSTYIALARVQVFAGKYDDALLNAENSLLLNNNNSMAYAIRGWALTKKLDYTNADESLKKALQLDPANGQAHAYNAFLYGTMYENDAGPYPDPITTAIAESNAAITLAPNNLEAHWARAYILSLTDNLEQARDQYLDAIEINKNIAEIHLQLGVTYRLLNVIDQAIQEYTKANTFNPSDYRPELYSSRADAVIGEKQKAIQWAEKAVLDDPANPDLHGNLGYMLYQYDDWQNAIDELALAIDGGTTADGLVVAPLDHANTQTWINKYYYAYALSLAQVNRCAEVILLTQRIRDYFNWDPYAELNAAYAEENCSERLKTPSPRPAQTITLTPTP
jgi:tetratricopeptide (TPR) repeat protein